ncbi:MAG: hypothetical protein WCZ89_07835 [Phycisphaerae bacterium]
MKKNLIIVALLCLIVIMFILFVVIPTNKERNERKERNTVIPKLNILSEIIHNYTRDNNSLLPTADNWCDVLIQYDKNLSKEIFMHPRLEGVAIAFNKKLSGLSLEVIPKDTVLLFEAQGGLNLSGGKELVKTPNLNYSTVYILLINGKIEQYWVNYIDGQMSYKKTVDSLRWEP